MSLPSQGSAGAQPQSLLQACLWVPYSISGFSGSQGIDLANLEADPERQSGMGTHICSKAHFCHSRRFGAGVQAIGACG